MTPNLRQEIDFASGFGPLRFGWLMGEVETVLGRPDEEEFVDPETKMAVVWCYKPLKLQVAFYEYPGAVPASGHLPLRVVSFLTGHDSATLWDTRVVGLRKPELLKLFDDHGYSGFTSSADELDSSGYETLRSDDSRITLDLHKGLLKRMLWGCVHEQEIA